MSPLASPPQTAPETVALTSAPASPRAYLDWNATAPLTPAAREALLEALSAGGNASAVHADGRAARARVEEARRAVAALAGADNRAVTFVSGASEANMTALVPEHEIDGKPVRFPRLIHSAVEHPSVMAGGRFAPEDIRVVPVDSVGIVDLAALEAAIAAAVAETGAPPLVSLMAANNETGIIQPVRAAADLVHAVGGLFHVDATQAAGRSPATLADLGADLMSLSAHKIGGPVGAGALVRAREGMRPKALISGGGQEGRARAGTENVPAIAGFGAAAREALAQISGMSQIQGHRDWLEDRLRLMCPQVTIFGADGPRLGNTSAFAVEGVPAELALIALDLDGISVSSGSACSSGKVSASHVLQAMGVAPVLARCGLRVSLGATTTREDLERFLASFGRIVARLVPGRPVRRDAEAGRG